jgi:hypothetical protein
MPTANLPSLALPQEQNRCRSPLVKQLRQVHGYGTQQVIATRADVIELFEATAWEAQCHPAAGATATLNPEKTRGRPRRFGATGRPRPSIQEKYSRCQIRNAPDEVNLLLRMI